MKFDLYDPHNIDKIKSIRSVTEGGISWIFIEGKHRRYEYDYIHRWIENDENDENNVEGDCGANRVSIHIDFNIEYGSDVPVESTRMRSIIIDVIPETKEEDDLLNLCSLIESKDKELLTVLLIDHDKRWNMFERAKINDHDKWWNMFKRAKIND